MSESAVAWIAALAAPETTTVVVPGDSGTPWIAMITALAVTVGFFAQIILQVLAMQEAARVAAQAKVDALKAQQSAEKAAISTDEVKQALTVTNETTASKLDGLATVASQTHVLVNSNMSAQLQLNAAVTRRLADLTKGTPDGEADATAADIAEKQYRDHESKQSIVDAKEKADAKVK